MDKIKVIIDKDYWDDNTIIDYVYRKGYIDEATRLTAYVVNKKYKSSFNCNNFYYNKDIMLMNHWRSIYNNQYNLNEHRNWKD